jgi:peroxiredoxin Q/BCP
MTPGCTVEALGFRDTLNDLKALDVQVLGVSADTCGSHKKFAQKHQLNFPLLADTDKKVINAYGVLKEKSMYGKKYIGTLRNTYLLDSTGHIIHSREKVSAPGHAQNVLDYIQSL